MNARHNTGYHPPTRYVPIEVSSQPKTSVEHTPSFPRGDLFHKICDYLHDAEVFEIMPFVCKSFAAGLQNFPMRLDLMLDHSIPLEELRNYPIRVVKWKIIGVRLDAAGCETLLRSDFEAFDLRNLELLFLENVNPCHAGDLGSVLDECRYLQALQLYFRGELPDEGQCMRLVNMIHERIGLLDCFETNLLDLPNLPRSLQSAIRTAWTAATYEQRINSKTVLAAIEPILRLATENSFGNQPAYSQQPNIGLGLTLQMHRASSHDDVLTAQNNERKLLNALLEMCLVHGRNLRHSRGAVRKGADALLFGLQLAINYAQDLLNLARVETVSPESKGKRWMKRMQEEDDLISNRFSDHIQCSIVDELRPPQRRFSRENPGSTSRLARLQESKATGFSATENEQLVEFHQDELFLASNINGGTAPGFGNLHDSVPVPVRNRSYSSTSEGAQSADGGRRLRGRASRLVPSTNALMGAVVGPRSPPAQTSHGFRIISDAVEDQENRSRHANTLRVQVPPNDINSRDRSLVTPSTSSSSSNLTQNQAASSSISDLKIPVYGPASSRSSSLRRTSMSLPAHLQSEDYTWMLVRHLWREFLNRIGPRELPELISATSHICHYSRGIDITDAIILMLTIVIDQEGLNGSKEPTIYACALISDLARRNLCYSRAIASSPILDHLLEDLFPEQLGMLSPSIGSPLGGAGRGHSGGACYPPQEVSIDLAMAASICEILRYFPNFALQRTQIAPALAFLASRSERILLQDPSAPELQMEHEDDYPMVFASARRLILSAQTLTFELLRCDALEDQTKILVPRTFVLVLDIGHRWLEGPPEAVREASFRIADCAIYLKQIGAIGIASCDSLVDFLFDITPHLADVFMKEAIDFGIELVQEREEIQLRWMRMGESIIRRPPPDCTQYPVIALQIMQHMINLAQQVDPDFVIVCQCTLYLFKHAQDLGMDMSSLSLLLESFQHLLNDFFHTLAPDSQHRLYSALSGALLPVTNLVNVSAEKAAQQLTINIYNTLALCVPREDNEPEELPLYEPHYQYPQTHHLPPQQHQQYYHHQQHQHQHQHQQLQEYHYHNYEQHQQQHYQQQQQQQHFYDPQQFQQQYQYHYEQRRNAYE